MIANVVFREIQTFCVLVDIYRGVPAIYTTYYGYDEVAHHYGPLSKPAMRALGAIDTRLRQIDRFRRLGLAREYDLYILSDHGMTAAVPFELEYGQTLEEALRSISRAQMVDTRGEESRLSLQAHFLREELEAIADRGAPSKRVITQRLRRALSKRRAPSPRALPLDLAAGIVSSSGPLSHLYLTVASWQMSMDEVLQTNPDLVARLVAHSGIGMVLGRQGRDMVLVSEEGGADLLPPRRLRRYTPIPRRGTGSAAWPAESA